MAGISEPGLMASGFWIHRRRFSVVFSAAPGRDRVAAHQVRQIGAEASSRIRAADRVAVHAGGGFEDALARDFCLILIRGLLLRANPSVKILGLSTETRKSILACCVPQYCAHWPR